MFPYCCLLIICIMLFSCSVFKVHLSFIRSKKLSGFTRALRSTNDLSHEAYFLPIHYYLLPSEWWAKVDSNHRPHDYQSCALASWAIGPFLWLPGDLKWWRLAGSNRWPPACKAGALPAELNPHIQSTHQSVPSKLNNVNRSSTLYWP